MDKQEPVKNALTHFFMTTTLHGFKYLCSEFVIDRVGWVLSSVASTCCAGVLCAVLWARFEQVPALLQLRDMRPGEPLAGYMPQVAVYPPMHSLRGFFQDNGMNHSMIGRLTRTIENVLAGRNTAEDQLKNLEKLFSANNTTLTEVLLQYTPNCSELITSCRWQSVEVPCNELFDKELMIGGVCCIMRPDKAYNKLVNSSSQPTGHYQQTKTLDLALHCSNETYHHCKFLAKYDAEPNVQSMVLAPGYIYFAQMLFNSVPMSSAEEVVESNCNTGTNYSREICLDKCAEEYCGCIDPLRDISSDENIHLPMCSVMQLSCLRTFNDQANATCHCQPSCDQFTSDINLESTAIIDTFTIDPIYNGLDAKSTVIHLRLSLSQSKIFMLNPTETWLTLLSSLGGVFNMFLGVGLFSGLEILFLLLFYLPKALLKSQFN